MNAPALFLRGLAMLGKPRAKQSVHRISSRRGGYSIFGGPAPVRHVVMVTPEGEERGTYYEVSPKTLEFLEDGTTPEQLDLEPFDASERDEDDFEEEFNNMRRKGAF